MWFIPQYVFINNVSFRSFFQPWFSFSIISHKLFTSISKEIYCGHINHRKLFQCCFMIDDKEVKESRFACSWFAVWAWWMLSFSYFQKMWIALTLYLIWRVWQIWTVVISLNDHINHRKTYSLYWHLCQTSFRNTVYHILYSCSLINVEAVNRSLPVD